jgi:hypothetical protein
MLKARSRRRPLPSTGTGVTEARLRCAHRSSILAGPFDAVIDVVRSRRLRNQRVVTSSSGAWSSLRPSSPPISSSSFASSPCCPPVMSEWRRHQSARGDREHCNRITPATKKSKHFRMIECVKALFDTRYRTVASAHAVAPQRSRERARRQSTRFSKRGKVSITSGFSTRALVLKIAASRVRVQRAGTQNSCQEDALHASLGMCKKFLRRSPATALASGESDANRANRPKVIRAGLGGEGCFDHRRVRARRKSDRR